MNDNSKTIIIAAVVAVAAAVAIAIGAAPTEETRKRDLGLTSGNRTVTLECKEI